MMASPERICIFGYDRRKDEPFNILNCAIPLERKFMDSTGAPIREKVIMVTPVADTIHNFILVVTRKELTGHLDEKPSTILRILRICPPQAPEKESEGRKKGIRTDIRGSQKDSLVNKIITKVYTGEFYTR